MNKCPFFLQAAFCGFVTILVSLNSNAQSSPAKQWEKTFGGNAGETLTSMLQTTDGGYILGGTSESGISGDKSQATKGGDDFWVVKLDASGNKAWDKTFGGIDSEGLISMQQTVDGGYILGGVSNSGIGGDKSPASRGDWDYWIVKLDVNGTKQWDKTFGSSSEDFFSMVKQTSDGGYILGGTSWSGISGDKSQYTKGKEDYWIIKLDGNGNKVWDKIFGGTSTDQLSALQQTSDGGYILGGTSLSDISGDKTQVSYGIWDYWVVKLDAAGNKLWDRTYGGNIDDYLFALQQTSDGGFIFGGYSLSGNSGVKSQIGSGNRDYWVVKTDAVGNKQWDKTFGGADHDFFTSLQQVLGGGYLLGGYSFSGIGGEKTEPNKGAMSGTDYWIVKLDPAGNKVWDKTLGGSNGEYLTSLQQINNGGYIFGGYSYSGISGDKTEASRGLSDFWIVKLAADVLGTNKMEATNTNQLFQNQPNPFSKNTIISFSLTQSEEVGLTIYNSLGQMVAKHQKKYDAGKHQVLWEELVAGKSLKAGTYFYQLSAGEFQDTKRMVLLD